MITLLNGPPLVGEVFSGYCHGYFGENYNDKCVEAVGADWIVVRSAGTPLLASFHSTFQMIEEVEIWQREIKEGI